VCGPAEQALELAIERRDIVRLAAGDELAVHHDFLIDPLGARVGAVVMGGQRG